MSRTSEPTKVPKKESLSPPTYSVESNESGRLYSQKYRIDWPKRPKDGTHSVEAEMQMRIGTSKPEAPDEDIEEAKLIRQCELRACADEDAMVFDIRAMTMKHATRRFDQYQQRNFMIYYQMPSVHNRRINELSTAIPLMYACRSSNGKITHYQVKCYTCKDESGKEDIWRGVKFNGDDKPVKETRCIGFTTMEALLEYWCAINAECRIKVSKC